MLHTFSELVELFQGSAVPKWLHDYMAEHRDRVIAELRLDGKCTITSPDGKTVINITAAREKE